MSITKISKHVLFVSILSTIAFGSCKKKCDTCLSNCVIVHTHPPDSPYVVIAYDTFCSENFPSFQAFSDTLKSSRYALDLSWTKKTFSSCGASEYEIQRAYCY